ncbi:lysylphosphatidylglycerol synthase domain-containing protein [Phenylobacterium sp.]|uniref:lysylphosphatidylglycerol synthase domain-containing protein n=1 Tax=Phenylobacterium sp. TaxID=1871053 RepID=UPI002BD482B7|nr:lysylphosphatidylglycerol synthase domain-containing protein [Phenylobacterium sp.]HLZ73822.1 lysylphosphatidylglycerol synthase domain-containing protein [Phenylobacterium sp.]
MTAPNPTRSSKPEPVVAELAQDIAHPHAGLPGRLGQWAHWALRIVPPVMLVAAIWVLWREFHKLSFEAVKAAMAGWGLTAILMTLVLSVVSFLLMGLIEWVGLRWTGARVPMGPTQMGSFLANGIAHAIGANLLTSGAIRARFYERFGVSLTQAAGATLFAAFSFGVGLAALSGAGLLLAASADLDRTAITPVAARALGAGLLAVAAGYVVLCALRRRPLSGFGRSVTLPSARDAAAQLVLGVVDNGIAAAILWILLPAGGPSYVTFVGAYAVACITGLISSVPGGAGVFESAMAALLPDVAPAALAAAFLGYRLSYYILPLFLAALALAVETLRNRRA